MTFLWSSVFSAVGGILGGWGRLGLIAGIASLVLGTAYVKGRVHGSDSTERKLRPVISKLETEKRNLLGAIEDVKRLEREIDEELEKARKAGDSIKPVTVYKHSERLRKIGAYPGCRDCK